ncbi:MAG: choice-of-anchor D domain-containing protein [Spirochaetes bacterium]|nr:choice-of-anchor D domain-containing protein [Spirochaetota bacterium]
MLRRKLSTGIVVLVSLFFFTQCERNNLQTNSWNPLSLLGIEQFFSFIPTVTIGAPSTAAVNSSGSVNYNIIYSNVTTVNLTATDVTLTTTGTATCAPIIVTNGTTFTPTVTLSGCTGDGTATITIAAGTSSDDEGNMDTGTGPGPAVAVDNTIPGLMITTPAGGAYVNGTAVIVFTDTEPTTPEVSVDNINWTAATNGVTTLSAIPEFAGVGETGFTLYLRDTDAAGNSGNASRNIIKDTVLPTVAITTAPTINAANQTTYSVSGNCSDVGTTVIISINGTDNTSGTCMGGGTFSATLMNVSAPPDGTVTVAARQTDTAGNQGSGSTAVSKDTVAPTVSISAPSPSLINSLGNSSFAVTYTDADTVNLTNGDISQTPAATCGTVNVTGGTTSTPMVTLSGCTGDGTVAITVAANTASDTAGNTSLAEGPSGSLTVDNDAPDVTFTSTPTINSSNASGYVVSGTCENGLTVTVTVGVSVIDTPTCSGGSFTTGTMNVSGVSEGPSVSVTAEQTDAAGNSGIDSTTVVKDTVAPSSYGVSFDQDPVNSANEASVSFTFGGAELGAAYNYSITDGTGTVSGSGTVAAAGETITGINVSGLGDGTLTLSVTLTDAAGNIGAAVTDTATKNTIPDINLQYSGTNFVSGDGIGATTYVGTPLDLTFTIQNLGGGDLTSVSYSLTGTSAGEFIVSGPSTVAAGDLTATFTITFDPTAAGYRPAILEIHSDDPDEPVYYVNLNSCYAYLPDINVKVGAVNYLSGSSSYNFGTVQQGTSKTVTFTVQNTGTGTLTIGVPSPSVGVFVVSDPGLYGAQFYNIPGGASENITVTFTPNASTGFSDTLSISSNDVVGGESPYTITLTGNGVSAPAPDISLKVGSTEYPSGSSTFSFGAVEVGVTKTATFTIKNNGVGGLELSAWPWIVTGSTFSVTGIDEMSIPGGGTTTFTVAYTPDAADSDSGILSIASNDPDTPSYWINLSGAGSAAAVQDIQLTVDGIEYVSGGSYNLGMVQSGGGLSGARFVITNKGTSALTILANPSVADTTHFSTGTLTPSSTIAAGGSSYFDVNFAPISVGPLSTVLTIISNDPDVGTFTLNLNGSGYGAATPDILVSNSGGSVYYPSGCDFDFGEVLIGGTSLTSVYEIQNSGSMDLNIYNVTITGIHAGEYTITLMPSLLVTTSSVGDLEITFDPAGEGVRTAAVEIETDDPDEPFYVINLTGRGVMPMMVVNGGGSSSNTATYDPINNEFTNAVSIGPVSSGGHSFLMDSSSSYPGRRMVIHSNGTATSIYNPADQSKITNPTSPSTITGIGYGAHSFKITGGSNINSYLVVCGGVSNATRLYNQTTDSFDAGIVTMGANVGYGSFSLPTASGDRVIVLGNGPYYQVFYQATNTMDPLMEIDPTAYIYQGGHASLIPAGALQAGKWLVIEGLNITWLYDPSGPSFSSGPNLTGNAGLGAHSIPIKEGPNAGCILIFHGENGGFPTPTTTSVYNKNNTITSGPIISPGIDDGAFSFRINGGVHKGKFMVIHGGSSQTTSIFNPITMSFEAANGTDDLPQPASSGAHCFPAR